VRRPGRERQTGQEQGSEVDGAIRDRDFSWLGQLTLSEPTGANQKFRFVRSRGSSRIPETSIVGVKPARYIRTACIPARRAGSRRFGSWKGSDVDQPD